MVVMVRPRLWRDDPFVMLRACLSIMSAVDVGATTQTVATRGDQAAQRQESDCLPRLNFLRRGRTWHQVESAVARRVA